MLADPLNDVPLIVLAVCNLVAELAFPDNAPLNEAAVITPVADIDATLPPVELPALNIQPLVVAPAIVKYVAQSEVTAPCVPQVPVCWNIKP